MSPRWEQSRIGDRCQSTQGVKGRQILVQCTREADHDGLHQAKSALPDIEFDLIVAEQLSDVVPCEHADCDAAAVFTFRHDCGELWIYCQKHRVELDKTVEAWWAAGTPAMCDGCDRRVPRRLPWRSL